MENTKSNHFYMKFVRPFTLTLLLFFHTTSQALEIKYTPIMMDDITMFVPYTEISVSLGSDRNLGTDEIQVLTPTIEHEEQVVSYAWSEGSTVLSTNASFSTAILGLGIHTITLTLTDSNGLTTSDTIVITIEDPIDESGIAASSTVVGTTKGEFSVGQGSANYNLTIDVPPGIAGMEPKLSLAYSSGGGNGYMGVGWSIGGVSAITRCPQSEAVDGGSHKFGVNYNSDDRFCLDGQRLIAVSGVYGADATEYKTEIDSYSRIIAHGNSNSSSAWFEVKTKSGLSYHYGESDNASQMTQNNVSKFWKVSSIVDTFDNTIAFVYHSEASDGEHYLTSVTYADNTISYNYEESPRPDIMQGYHAGEPYLISTRLESVSVTTGSIPVRSYHISYEKEDFGSKRSKVKSITEHVPKGDLKTLHFFWKDSDRYGLTKREMSLPFSEVKVENNGGFNISYHIKQDKGVQFADINADGFKDIIQLYQKADGSYIKNVCLSNGIKIDNCDNNFTDTIPNAYFSSATGESMGTRLADINADGLIDIIQLYNPDNSYYGGVPQRYAWINTGSGFTAYAYNHTLPDAYFTGSDGKDMGTRLADINGDGWVDLIQLYIPNNLDYGGVPQKRVHLNSALGFGSGYTVSLDVYFADQDGEDMGTRLADINGDGLVDLIQIYNPDIHYGGAPQSQVWLNNGGNFVASTYAVPHTFFTDGDGKDMGSRLADINGDGLPDLIQMFQSSSHYGGAAQKKVYLNSGKTFAFDEDYSNSLPFGIHIAGEDGESRGTRLADINGDGLLDIIQLYLPSNGQGKRKVYLNRGGGFAYNHTYSTALSDTYFSDGDGKDMGTQLADVNGDGFVDVIQVFTSDTHYEGIAQKRVYINKNNPILVTEINNYADQVIEVNYKDMVDAAVYYNYSTHGERNSQAFNKIANGNIELTLPQELVFSAKSNNGVGGMNRVRYKYYGYIINKLRGLQGFHKITTYDVTTHSYSTNLYKQIGVKNGSEDKEGFEFTGMPYKQYMHYSNEDNLSLVEIYYQNNSGRIGIYEPYTHKNTQKIYDPLLGTLIKTVSHTNELKSNNYGDIKKTIDTIKDEVSGVVSIKTTSNTYATENTDKWYIGRLSGASVTHKTGILPILTRSSTFEYDSDTGVLTKEVANSHSTLDLTKEYTYYDNGNKKTEEISGSGITTAKTIYGYDSLGKFQTSMTNADGLSETRTYNQSFGTVASLTGPNGLTTTWEYDDMGRKIKETRADGSTTTWKHNWTNEANLASMEKALYSVAVSSKTAPFTRTYYDSLGRDVGSYTYTLKKTPRNSDTSRRIVKRKYYNAKGELKKEELPHYQGETFGKIETTYDSYGRSTSVTKTGANDTLQTYSTIYDKFTQTTTDPNSAQKRTVKNALGQIKSITDAFASSSIDASTIAYEYDSIGNLLKTTDSAGNTIIMEYDSAGNKIKMNDPDLGIWEYEYNALGQMTFQTNALGQDTNISYDVLGRITSKNVIQGTSYHNTSYAYGSNAATIGSKGKLLKTTNASALDGTDLQSQTITYTYDSKGRATQTSTTITGRDAYISKVTYDTQSRPLTQTYPNGYRITNHYKNGILDQVIGSDGKVHYTVNQMNAFGEIADATFANGVRTVLGHDSAGYIGSIRSGQNGLYMLGNVQQVHYTYDGLGNVLTRNDSSITNKTIDDTFTYDAMNRLYSQNTDSDVIGNYAKSKAYRYDKLGNMTHQYAYNGFNNSGGTHSESIGAYTYYTDKPHAVKTAGTRAYTYDLVGNMTHRNNDLITYNPLNKPAILTNHLDNKEVKFSMVQEDNVT